MPHVIEKTVYMFDELEERAKKRARDWFRETSAGDDWHEHIYSDAVEIGALLGIEIDARNQRCVLVGDKPREWIDRSPAIYFSGFSSQGDGACFEGSYSYAKGAAKKIREYAPQDTELHRIADELQAAQRKAFYRATATMKHRGHYYHSGCMSVDVDGIDKGEDAIRDAMRAFADWIYRQLEKEYEWQNADEQVDENIRANEYEFDETGRRAT